LKKIILTFLLFHVFFGTSVKAQISEDQQAFLDSLYDKGYEVVYNNTDSSLSIATYYLDTASAIGDSLEIAYASNILGLANYYKNELEEAEYLFKRSIRIFTKHEDLSNLGDAYSNLGSVLSDQGYYQQAIDYYLLAYHIHDSLADEESKAFDLNSMAIVFFDQEDYKSAEEYINRSLEIGEPLKLESLNAANYNLLGELEIKKGNILKANVLTQKAFQIAQKDNDLLELACCYSNFGLIEIERGQFEEGIQMIQKAVEYAKQFGDPYSVGMYLTYLSNANLKANRNTQALVEAEKASVIIHSTSSSRYLKREVYLSLANANSALANYEKAIRYFKEYKLVSDTILNLDIKEKLLQQQNKIQDIANKHLEELNKIQEKVIERNGYLLIGSLALLLIGISFIIVLVLNVNRRKRYSKLLLEKNRIIRSNEQKLDEKSEELLQKNLELSDLVEAKNKLFSILTHDIKEPFNQVLNVLELLDYDALSEEERREMTATLKESASGTQEMVNNLLYWSKSQFSGIQPQPETVDVKDWFVELNQNLKTNLEQKEIEMHINLEANSIVFADYGQILIALRNLLMNAIKFSNNASSIFVQSKSLSSNHVVIEIKDEGIGISPQRLKRFEDFGKIVSTEGTLNEKGTGLGVLIVKDLVEQNKGTLHIESIVNKGSTFSITLPKPE
jgi:signal transduction histidine kinase/Tfp pilus assembly protein PilF